jgi:hypothetical protein
MKKLSLFLMILFAFSMIAFAQPRPNQPTVSNKTVAKAPERVATKYEGGMFGYSKKEEGVLTFDDANERLVFFGKDGKEKFSIPYQSMLVIMPSSKSQTSTTGTVVSNIPIPGAGLLGSVIKEKKHYLVIQFADPDVDRANGITNFKIENKDLLESIIFTLGEKAKMKQRGEAFYRPSNKTAVDVKQIY